MNKQLKRLILFTMMINSVSLINPIKNINFTNTKAYADSYTKAYLNDIDVNYGTLDFSKTKTSYSLKVGNSVDEIRIDTSSDSDYEVTIDGYERESKTIDLDKGDNRIKIKVRDKTGDKDTVTYYLNIIRGDSSSDSSDYDYDDDVYLKNITVNDGSLNFSKYNNSYTVNVDESVGEIKIKAEPEYSYDTVSIDGNIVDEDSSYRKTVSLNKGSNVVVVSVGNDDEKRNYRIYVNRGASSTNSGLIDSAQDSIYLDNLLIDSGNIPLQFNKRVTTYNVNVKNITSEIIIKAEPEDNDHVVRVNDDKVDSYYRKLVKLNEGKNEIKVKISNSDDYFEDNRDYKDNYEERTYTINVYRESSSSGNAQNNNITTKASQWVNVMAKWQYNDVNGNPLKNIWFFDKNYNKSYFLDADGFMKTGWIYYNGDWYYTDESGAKQTGWKYINNSWYYLDIEGRMKKGWFKDADEKWYFLYQSGAMATNAVIDGFKINSKGVWVGKNL